MQKIVSFLRARKKITYGIIFFILIIASFLILKNKNITAETITVIHSHFVNQVSVSGKVVPSSVVDLGFKNGGRIQKVYFSVGDMVKKDQVIANLDSNDASGQLNIAKANYEKIINGATSTDINVAKAQVETAQVALDQIKIQQDILLKNAKKNLLNSGFIATTDDQTSNQTPPIISGTYLKENEGQLIITEYPSSGGTSFKTSGLFEFNGMVNTEVPQSIGDTGLYIKFSNTNNYQTKWTVNIPNNQSAQYLQNLNAYQTAVSNQTQAIANATAELDQAKSALVLKQSNARPEDIASANGALLVAEGAYNDKFIFAPFDGMITKIDAKVGEIAFQNIPLVSMIGAGIFQIESYVPEINIANIKLGDEGNVTLDAYGPDVSFPVKVISIDPAETIRDGVSTYRIKLQFNEKDDRIKSGMTANVSIKTLDKSNTIVLPEGVVFEKNGKKFVQVKKNNQITEREIATGDKSSLGQIEIVSGLSDGETVILNPILK